MIITRSAIDFDILPIEGSYNTRDLGGHSNSRGKMLNKRKFIRSASLSGITEEGIKVVYDLGIDCIIDLRTTYEREMDPSSFEEDEHIKYKPIPLEDYAYNVLMKKTIHSFPNTMGEVYIWTLENNKENLKEIMSICAHEKHNTIVFHCASGKDRTGLLAMFLLSIVEVDKKIIFEDYLLSAELLKPLKNNQLTKRNPLLAPYFFNLKKESLQDVIMYLNNEYGSVINYLTSINVTLENQQGIQEKFLG